MNNFFRRLKEFYDKIDNPGFMCYYECFMGDLDEQKYIPFTDDIQSLLPVLNGTKYTNENTIDSEIAKALGELSQIPEPSENHYNKKIEYILNLPFIYRLIQRELFISNERTLQVVLSL